MSKKSPKSNFAEHRLAVAVDELSEHEEFKLEVLPLLRKAINCGKSAQEIYEMVEAHAAARAATIALTEVDSSKALAAIKEVLDRTQGKATERQDITHHLEGIPDEQLDALLKTKLQGMEADDEEEEEPLHS